jgi:hypothetical protein
MKVRQIHEIELSSRCNLACVYCPHPKMKRAKEDMRWSVFERALEHVRYYCDQNSQGELALTGLGEALLYDRFVDAVLCARDAIGASRLLTFSTNGILLDEKTLDAIRPADPIVFVSLHRPEVAAPVVDLLRRSGLRYGTNNSFVDSALNWVGDVDWHVSHTAQECAYLRDGWSVVRADGHVGTCCWDAETEHSRIGHVDDPLGSFITAPHAACAKCSLTVPLSAQLGKEATHAR